MTIALRFSRHPDPERERAYYFNADMANGCTVVVHEVSIGVWGWLIVRDSDGAPLEMRNGFTDSNEAMNHVINHVNNGDD